MYGDFILLLTLRRGLPAGRQVGRKWEEVRRFCAVLGSIEKQNFPHTHW